jgi:hypothetical protein
MSPHTIAQKLASMLAEEFKRQTRDHGSDYDPMQGMTAPIGEVLDRFTSARSLWLFVHNAHGYVDSRMRQALHSFVRGDARELVAYAADLMAAEGPTNPAWPAEWTAEKKRTAVAEQIGKHVSMHPEVRS